MDAATVRVSVIGKDALPTQEVTLRVGGLAYSLNPQGSEEVVEIVVTGEREGGYRVPNASTTTRTDTPLRDIPQSIQVIPRQVLEDRGVRRELEALETVSGVVDIQDNLFDAGGVVNIRGFQSNTRLQNG